MMPFFTGAWGRRILSTAGLFIVGLSAVIGLLHLCGVHLVTELQGWGIPHQLSRAVVLAAIVGGAWIVAVGREGRRLRSKFATDPVPAAGLTHSHLGLTMPVIAQRYADPPGSTPYVARDRDSELVTALQRERVILVFGQPGAGKSRSTYEVIRTLEGVRRYTVVTVSRDDSAALGEILNSSVPWRWRRAGVLLLVDGLDRYLDHHDPPTDERVQEWLERAGDRARVVASLSQAEYFEIKRRSTKDSARRLIDMAHPIEYRLLWSEEEQARAREMYPLAGSRVERLSSHFVEFSRELDDLRNLRATDAGAYATVRAAVDWVRCGLARPVSGQWLEEAAPDYVQFADDLQVTRPVSDDIATCVALGLLQQYAGDQPGWLPSSNLVGHYAELERKIPWSTWERVNSVASPKERLNLARAAGRLGHAELEESLVQGVLADREGSASVRDEAMAEWRRLLDATADPEQLDALRAAEAVTRPGTTAAGTTQPSAVGDATPPAAMWVHRHPAASAALRVATLAVGDAVGLWLSVLFVYLIAAWLGTGTWTSAIDNTNNRIFFVVFFGIALFAANGLYRTEGHRSSLARVMATLGEVTLLLLVVQLARGQRYSTFALFWAGLAATTVVVCAIRWAHGRVTKWLLQRSRNGPIRTVVVGEYDAVSSVAELLPQLDSEIEVVGAVRSSTHPLAPQEAMSRPPDLGDVAAIDEILIRSAAHLLVIADPVVSSDLQVKLVDSCSYYRVGLLSVAPPHDVVVDTKGFVPGDPVVLDHLTVPRVSPLLMATKRAVDIFGSILLLVMAGPLILLYFALLFVRGERDLVSRWVTPGFGGIPFTLLRLATPYRSDGTRAFLPRLVERTAFDEVLQCVNVLRGDMSLVGPRPIDMSDFRRLTPTQLRRYSLRPGISGLWQIAGRSDDNYDDVVALDLLYARKLSFFLDLEILVKTVRAALVGPRSHMRGTDRGYPRAR